mgnify:FL=1
MNKILENDKKRVFTKNVNTLIMFLNSIYYEENEVCGKNISYLSGNGRS